MKEALGLNDYKVKYYLPLAYPGVDVLFGDLDGDGQDDKLETLDDRIAALRWGADLVLELVGRQTYENVEFAGFYWQNESMNENEDDNALINTIVDYVGSKGYELFWIPFYKASGFDACQHTASASPVCSRTMRLMPMSAQPAHQLRDYGQTARDVCGNGADGRHADR